MRDRCSPFFLTFVLILLALAPRAAFALPSDPSPDINQEAPPPSEPTSGDATKIKTLDIAPAPPPTEMEVEAEYFHPFRRALTFRLALQYDTHADNNGKNTSTVLGTQYLFSPKNLKNYEIGADLQSDGAGVLHVAQRFIYSRGRFRPYWKAGLGLRVVPSERLATLLKYQNYYVRSAIGFEQLIKVPSSLRAELELTAGARSIQALASIGYVWSW